MRWPSRSAPASRITGCRRRAGRPACRVKFAVIADLHACKPWMDVERIEGIVAQVNALAARRRAAARRLRRRRQDRALSRARRPPGLGRRAWQACGRRSACMPCSAITIGGRMMQCSERRRGPTQAGLALQDAGITLHENTCHAAAQGWARRSGSPASATSGPSGRQRQLGGRVLRRRRRSAGTLALATRRRARSC